MTADSLRICGDCGAEVGTFPSELAGGTRYMWRVCPCREATIVVTQEQQQAFDARQRELRIERLLGAAGLGRLVRMTLDTFDPLLLTAAEGQHPYCVATAWIERAVAYGDQADYRDPASPPAALYFYSPGKGRGKTHLAAGLAIQTCRQLRPVAFLQEHSFLEHRWTCPLEELEQTTALPGEQAWLTVIDDIGQRDKTGPSVSDAWYAVVNRRWVKGGWTIITSNRTPDQLAEQGTINDATYSRLGQMTRGRLLLFDGPDRRWEVPA